MLESGGASAPGLNFIEESTMSLPFAPSMALPAPAMHGRK